MLWGLMNPIRRIQRAWRDFLQEYTIVQGPVDKGGYYIDSTDLWDICLDVQTERMDFKEGVLYVRYPSIGIQENPAYIAWYGLICLNRWFIHGDKRYLERAVIQGEWLANHAVSWNNAVRWEYQFDFVNGDGVLKAPWPSAMANGLAISLLVRLYRIIGEESFYKLALLAVKLFEMAIEDGGVAVDLNGDVYFEEYPVYPLTQVLDGTLFALLGLYDLSSEELLACKLFQAGATTIDKNWKIWDWNGVWSRYGCTGFLSTMLYHKLNCMLVKILQDIGYLKSFPLSGWERGLKWRKIVALCQMKKLSANHFKQYRAYFRLKGKSKVCVA